MSPVITTIDASVKRATEIKLKMMRKMLSRVISRKRHVLKINSHMKDHLENALLQKKVTSLFLLFVYLIACNVCLYVPFPDKY